jgi:AraC-binding-like domain
VHVRAGTFSLVDATRPFHLDYLDNWRAISFRVPAGSGPGLTATDRAMTARTFSATCGLAGVVGQTMRSLWTAAPELDEASAAAGAEALGSLLVALPHGGNAAEVMGSQHAPALLSRATHVQPDGDEDPDGQMRGVARVCRYFLDSHGDRRPVGI